MYLPWFIISWVQQRQKAHGVTILLSKLEFIGRFVDIISERTVVLALTKKSVEFGPGLDEKTHWSIRWIWAGLDEKLVEFVACFKLLQLHHFSFKIKISLFQWNSVLARLDIKLGLKLNNTKDMITNSKLILKKTR